ncbi:MAG: nucleotidyltransferase family protein [Porphyrobacter sp.]|nr:nucleotidyltransferase family protein [Porphyrobacter sp.]
MAQDLIDTYLAGCIRAGLAGAPSPPWPDAWADEIGGALASRVKFHGIALMLAQPQSAFAGWPAAVVGAIKEEARLQALWEASHRNAVMRLIKAFQAEGIRAAVLKGTALAYSVHHDPAMRRRGDTDLLLPNAPRPAARAILRECGFVPAGDRGPTQEPWSIATRDGFAHEVDIHWRINGSLAISRVLEQLKCEDRIAPLPRLAPGAETLGPVDNLILISVNRYSHQCFGYHVEDGRPADGDRLIWAADIKLVTDSFSEADWTLLANLAVTSGTAGLVRSALVFAEQTVGSAAPREVLDRLAEAAAYAPVAAYLGEPSAMKRLKLDLAALTTVGEFLTLVRLRLWPGRRFMEERFDDAQDWPLWALRIRRLVSGLLKRLGLAT